MTRVPEREGFRPEKPTEPPPAGGITPPSTPPRGAEVASGDTPDGFTRYARGVQGTGQQGRAWVSIYAVGLLTVSGAALERIGDPSHVVFLHDRDVCRIGIQATDAGDPDAYPVRHHATKRGAARLVSAGAFFKHIGLDAEAAKGTYTPEFVDERTLSIRPKQRSEVQS